MRKHLAVMHPLAIEAILSGYKTIESRFSKHNVLPFGHISPGDLVYIKAPGKDIIGQFYIKKVFCFSGLNKADIEKIFQLYGKSLSVGDREWDEHYFRNKQDSSYGTLLFISKSERFITSPIKIKKKDLRSWVVLDKNI